MEPQDAHLFRWTLPVPVDDPLPARLRHMEAIVLEEVGPFLRDPVVGEHAATYWLRKRLGVESREGSALELNVVAPERVAHVLAVTLARHVTSEVVAETHLSPSELIVLHPIAEEYRRGLREVTEIALELHAGSEGLRRHQCTLLRIGSSAEDPRFPLHAYLIEESPAYAALSSWGESSRDVWRHESFWIRMFTPGPAVELPRPLLLLWNIVVGPIPRRGQDSRALAESIGVECP